MRRSLAVLLVALAAAPLAGASASPGVSLQAGSVEWSGGQGSGPFVVLAAIGSQEAPSLTLTAAALDVAWDESATYFRAPGEPFVALFPAAGSAHYDQATLSVQAARAPWFAYAYSAGAATAQTDCGAASPSSTAERTAPVMVDGTRSPPRADTSSAIQVDATPDCPRPGVHLRGDLLLVLWELDGTLATPDGASGFQSGNYEGTNARQYFITAHGADLAFQGPASTPGLLYTAGLDVAADPLLLHDARGDVAGRAVDASLAVLHGPGLAAHVARQGDSLGLSAEHAARIELDGASVALADRPASLSPLAWAGLGVAVLAVALWLRRNSTTALLYRLDRLSDEGGRQSDVVAVASRVLKRNPHNLPVRIVRGLALGTLKRYEASMADLEAVVAHDEHGWKAVAAIGMALNLSEQGRDAEALGALSTAYAVDPSLARAAMNDQPALRRLWSTPDTS